MWLDPCVVFTTGKDKDPGIRQIGDISIRFNIKKTIKLCLKYICVLTTVNIAG
jgi:hypothetical protein